jgi:predicted AlkP superfamily pyrophosphatase or phosphodiesterase
MRFLLLLVGLLFPAGVVGEGPKPARLKHVLIIGIDGCRPDALLAARAPNLHGLIREGAFSAKAQTGAATISGPGWSSMLTGVWAEKHGVVDNSFKIMHFDRYPHFFRKLKDARPKAFTASVVNWAPIHSKIVTAADITAAEKNDDLVAERACRILSEHNPDALFLQLDEVDGAGHKNGFSPEVAAYLKAIEAADRRVGKVLKALRKRKTYAEEDWLILVSTDHGGSDKGHGKNIPEHRTIFLIVSGPSAAGGTIEPPPNVVDVAATALQHLGVAISPKWEWDGRPVGLKK